MENENAIKLVAVAVPDSESCEGCYFHDLEDCPGMKLPCRGSMRQDGRDIIWKEDK